MDAEGYIWSAHFESGTIRRISADGEIDRVIDLPVQWVASLTFGGDNHDILFVTTIGGEYDGERDGTSGRRLTARHPGIGGKSFRRLRGQ